MKLSHEFRPNPAHRYNLPPGVMVQSAKFGRRQVDIWQEAEPSPIWRGTPPQEVGRASRRLFTFVVHGEMSGTATSLEAARSEAERRATEGAGVRYRLDATAQRSEADAFQAYLDDIAERFPT